MENENHMSHDDMSQHSEDWELEIGSDLSRASTAPRPSSRPTSRMPDGAGLERLTTLARSNTIRMTTDAFEKLYLSPQNRVKGDLRDTFGIPTPVALIGFLISAGPLACSLMGWRGSGGGGVATIGASYFFGGLLQLLGAIMEWLVGNTFPFVCFATFGAFFFAYATIQNPQYGAQQAFLQGATTAEEKAKGMAEFQASYGFFFLFLAILCLIFVICSLRTNVVFFINMLLIEIAVCFLLAAAWTAAEEKMDTAKTMATISGACVFATCIIGYYLLAAQLLEAVAFPISLPVGDLSNRFGRSKRVPKVLPKEIYDA